MTGPSTAIVWRSRKLMTVARKTRPAIHQRKPETLKPSVGKFIGLSAAQGQADQLRIVVMLATSDKCLETRSSRGYEDGCHQAGLSRVRRAAGRRRNQTDNSEHKTGRRPVNGDECRPMRSRL